MAAASIEWNRISDDGVKRHVLAERVGDKWAFLMREKRFDPWLAVADPPLADWLELLDGVRRRIGRGLLKQEEEARVVKEIRRLFPGTAIPR